MVVSRRVRLLVLATYYHPLVGGAERHARQVATYAKRRGFEVQVLTKRVGRRMPARETIDGMVVRRLPPWGGRVSREKWLMIPFALAALVRLRHTYDVVFCPDLRGVGIAGVLAARLTGRPVVAGAATTGAISCAQWDPTLAKWGLNPTGPLVRGLKRPIQKFYVAADALACITRGIASEALACGARPERVHYLPNCVDPDRFRPAAPEERAAIRREEGWTSGELVVVFVGRLGVEKGVLDLLEAWRQVKPGRGRLVLIGPDMPGHHLDAGPRAREFAARHGLEGSVVFYGPRDDVPRLLRGADLYVQPSRMEAAPFAVIEALATGLPVVATRVGGMAEYLVDGVNALLSDPAEPAALARQLARCLEDPGLRADLGRRARETVLAEFDERVVLERYLTLFAQLADQACGRA